MHFIFLALTPVEAHRSNSVAPNFNVITWVSGTQFEIILSFTTSLSYFLLKKKHNTHILQAEGKTHFTECWKSGNSYSLSDCIRQDCKLIVIYFQCCKPFQQSYKTEKEDMIEKYFTLIFFTFCNLPYP